MSRPVLCKGCYAQIMDKDTAIINELFSKSFSRSLRAGARTGDDTPRCSACEVEMGNTLLETLVPDIGGLEGINDLGFQQIGGSSSDVHSSTEVLYMESLIPSIIKKPWKWSSALGKIRAFVEGKSLAVTAGAEKEPTSKREGVRAKFVDGESHGAANGQPSEGASEKDYSLEGSRDNIAKSVREMTSRPEQPAVPVRSSERLKRKFLSSQGGSPSIKDPRSWMKEEEKAKSPSSPKKRIGRPRKFAAGESSRATDSPPSKGATEKFKDYPEKASSDNVEEKLKSGSSPHLPLSKRGRPRKFAAGESSRASHNPLSEGATEKFKDYPAKESGDNVEEKPKSGSIPELPLRKRGRARNFVCGESSGAAHDPASEGATEKQKDPPVETSDNVAKSGRSRGKRPMSSAQPEAEVPNRVRQPQDTVDAQARTRPEITQIWFHFVAATKGGRDSELEQLESRFVKMTVLDRPVSFIHQYLRQKLNLDANFEIELTMKGKEVPATMLIRYLIDLGGGRRAEEENVC